jgi:uncharacterized RDD family membrane protein YckC
MPDSIADAQGRDRDHPGFDPRDIVTPHAFQVDEALLGTPLAAPWQRLVALLMDLAIAGFIANVAGGLVGVVVAYVFYRVATRSEIQSRAKRWARGCLVTVGAILLFGISISLVQDAQEWGPNGPSLTAFIPGVSPDPESVEKPTNDEEEEGPAIDPDSARLQALREVEALDDLVALRDRGDARSDTISPERSAALLRRYAEALAARDSAALDTLAGPAQSVVAGRRLDALERRVTALADRNDNLEDEAEQLRAQVHDPSIWRMVRATVNDFGITIGWVGLYFTLFLAWWDGRTPGKYLLGIRVVRLSGERLSLWFAFERFGGYAAGLATGLFGFAQLYWDPNRQAIHDRVARTVVVRTRTVEQS